MKYALQYNVEIIFRCVPEGDNTDKKWDHTGKMLEISNYEMYI